MTPDRTFAYVQLHKGREWTSRLIAWQTLSPYTHSSILMPDGTVYEAIQGHGVRMLHASEYQDDYRAGMIEVAPIDLSSLQLAEMRTFLTGELGKGYDWWGIIRFVARYRMPAKSKDAWFCSEYNYRAFRTGGIELLGRTEPWEVTPALLARSPLLPDPV